MTVQTRPLADVTHDAIRLLARELGIVETARFLGQFDLGDGDYTRERAMLFEGVSTDALIEEALNIRADPDAPAVSG